MSASSTNVRDRMARTIAATLARYRRAERRRARWDRAADWTIDMPLLGRLATWRFEAACRDSAAALSSLYKVERTLRRAGRHDRADEMMRAARGGA